MNYEVYGWADAVKRLWATVMNLLTFIVVDFSESLLKMLLSAFVLIAPFPNAVSVLSLSQEQLGFSLYSAIAFSAGIEFGPFVMIAISLMLFDGYLRGGKRWMGPFILTSVSTIVLVILITIIVYWLELVGGGFRVMSLLPWVSVAAFIGLAALAWHKAQPEIVAAERAEEDLKRKRKLHQRKEDLELALLEQRSKQAFELLEAQHGKRMGKLVEPVEADKGSKPFGLFSRKSTGKSTGKLVESTSESAQPLQLAPTVPQESLAVGGRIPEDPILQYLRVNGKQKTSAICAEFGISKPTANSRLQPLVASGLVIREQVGQAYFYSLAQPEEAG